ncbi:MAG: hypothetical protein WCO45_05455 [Pseudanabaena sp. ELA607]|jgi:uncharacterized protein YqiB (DUF1249 family)
MSQDIQVKSVQVQSEAPKASNAQAPAKSVTKRLYSDEVHAELLELQTDIELLFKQLQGLSNNQLSQVGSAQ